MYVFLSFLGQFDNEEPIHLQILQTVYKVLTATKIDCPRYGTHWDVIGFQVGAAGVCGVTGLGNYILLVQLGMSEIDAVGTCICMNHC